MSIAFALAFCWSPFACALNPDLHLTQYGHRAWRSQDGLFGSVNAITQTRDGYIWIGTDLGLMRFDGVRFVRWTPPVGKTLADPRISKLLTATDGSLWIGSQNGIARLSGDELTNFDLLGAVASMAEAADGGIWIARTSIPDEGGPICGYKNERFDCYANTGMPFKWATAVAKAEEGYLWIGSSAGLCRWKPDHPPACSLPESLASTGGNTGVADLAATSNGLLVGIARSGAGLGLQDFVADSWKAHSAKGIDGIDLDVNALLLDRDGGIWVGTFSKGLYRLHQGSADHFGTADGLSSDTVSSLYEDAEGTIWAATSKGLDAFSELPVTSYSKREGLTADAVLAVLADKDGAIWINNSGSLDILRADNVTAIATQSGLPGQSVTSLLQDHAGRLWVGTDDRLSIYEHGKFSPITGKDGVHVGTIWRLVEDSDQNVWAIVVGEKNRLLRIHNRSVVQEYDTKNPRILAPGTNGGIWLAYDDGKLAHFQADHVRQMLPDETGGPTFSHLFADTANSVWASSAKGLTRWKNGLQKRLDASSGLPCTRVYAFVADTQNALWLNSECGILVLAEVEIDRWWNDPQARIEFRWFDALDGAVSHAPDFQPKATRSPDGRLWFATNSVLQMVDPARVAKLRVPPPLRIENVTADREDFQPVAGMILPPLNRDVRIDYTALSFIAPQKIKFRYRLEGYDEQWKDAGLRRQAFYTNLGPGNYLFRVKASNSDGVWSESDATLSFVIPAVFYQTGSFLLLCMLGAGSLIWLAYLARVRQVAVRIEDRLAERASERERIARDLHDTLLQTLQGGKLAAETAIEGAHDSARLHKELVRISGWLGDAIADARMSLSHLRGMDPADVGLEEALRRVAEECTNERSMRLSFSSTGTPPLMQPVVRDEICRIAGEAIRNAAEHSDGTYVAVEMIYTDDLLLTIRDDGAGIDPHVAASGKEGHFGIRGMRERASRIGARVSITSHDTGTVVALAVPGSILAWSPEARSRFLFRFLSLLQRRSSPRT